MSYLDCVHDWQKAGEVSLKCARCGAIFMRDPESPPDMQADPPREGLPGDKESCRFFLPSPTINAVVKDPTALAILRLAEVMEDGLGSIADQLALLGQNVRSDHPLFAGRIGDVAEALDRIANEINNYNMGG